MLEEHPLDPERRDRAGFSCGGAELDKVLHRFASQRRKRGISTVFVLVDSAEPRVVLGFYTLSAAVVDAAELRDVDRKKPPRYRVLRMGRLACRTDRRGQVLGKLLMACAVERCQQARRQVAAYARIVDAKDEQAAAFYRQYGFVRCADAPLTLYLPLGMAR